MPLDEPAHLIRAMNILTLRHMDLEKVQQGWKALCSSLLPGGVLVVGRTRDESDGALLVSAYKKNIFSDFGKALGNGWGMGV